MHAPAALPKAGSGAARALWEQLRAVIDVPRAVIVLDGALDRQVLEEVVQKLTRGATVRAPRTVRSIFDGNARGWCGRSCVTAAAHMRKRASASCKRRSHWPRPRLKSESS